MPFSTAGFYLVALVSGAAFVLQQAVNTGLKESLGSPFWAALANFAIGGAALAVLLLAMREPVPALQAVFRTPWYGWIGGLLGALFIVAIVVLLPRLGAATMIGLFIVGQIVTSVLFDHFGLLGVPVRELGLWRALGMALMIVGVGLISLF